MTIEPPRPGEPRRPHGPRDPGDAWVVAPTGERYWGRFGAAGLLAIDAERGVLLQHRVGWSHFGGTWALPGGARHEGESAGDAALREAAEEAAVPMAAVRERFWSVLDVGVWTYTTVVADVVEAFEPVIADAESVALEWVPVDQVDQRPLHPGFEAAWKRLRDLVSLRPVVIVDAANVVGSVPDGWWKDRAGAAGRLLERIGTWAGAGVPAENLDLAEDVWFPSVRVVLEGQAKAAAPAGARGALEIVHASASGDDAIVAAAEHAVSHGEIVTVVTSDRGLAERVASIGAQTRGAGWLREMLDA
ncbi:NUDIX domain-containing protein [Microbacterium sediminicola]|uniref:NUDIX domain-containing protein n=1 Tax=Microbacterium sediminicola TaxID=415210 RepID=UPI0031DEBB19